MKILRILIVWIKKLFQDVAESFKNVFLAGRLLKDVGRNTTDLTEAILKSPGTFSGNNS